MRGLIRDRLALAHSADYTGCPEITTFIIEHAEDRYLNVQARIREIADREAQEPGSEEYKLLPVKAEKKASLRERLRYQLHACIP